ncbi:MAG: hypothetical protein QXH21_07960 [Ignisphaera sp.]
MSERQIKAYIIKLVYGETKAKKKIKVTGNIEPMFQLVPILGVGVLVDGKLKTFIPLTELEPEDSNELFNKYSINSDSISATVVEVTEETKEERELKLEH